MCMGEGASSPHAQCLTRLSGVRPVKPCLVLNDCTVMTPCGPKTVHKGDEHEFLTWKEYCVHLARGNVRSMDWKPANALACACAYPVTQGTRTKRVLLWTKTADIYSGGRILMWQYLLAMGENGWDAYLVTEKAPPWAKDYPTHKRVHTIICGKDAVPDDADLVVTNGKDVQGAAGLTWAMQHPNVPFVVWSFETENFINEYLPGFPLGDVREYMSRADYVLNCSQTGADYVSDYVGQPTRTAVLLPVCNTHAIAHARDANLPVRPRRDYVVWCGRGAEHKGFRTAYHAVFSCPQPLDLVVIGMQYGDVMNHQDHRVYICEQTSDARKMALIRGAKAVLCSSRFEGAGIVPSEAFCCGVPVIAFDLPVTRELYGDWPIYAPYTQLGCIVDKSDSDAAVRRDNAGFASVVHQFVADGCPKLPESVRRGAREKYGLEAMPPNVERLPYHSVKGRKVLAVTIAYWGLIPEAIDAVMPYVDEFRVAFGPTELVRDNCAVDDGSLERLLRLKDCYGDKLVIDKRDVWSDKREMWEAVTHKLDTDWMLRIGSDEVVVGLDEWLKDPPFAGAPRWVNFWGDCSHWIHDEDDTRLVWGSRLQPYGSACCHYRWSWWRNSYKWVHHTTPRDAQGKHVQQSYAAWYARNIANDHAQTCIYHFGHVLPRDVLLAKREFYKLRDKSPRNEREDELIAWDGTCGVKRSGVVCKVDWQIPEIVQQAIAGLNSRNLADDKQS